MFVLLCWYLGMWVWGDYWSRCCFLDSSLLDGVLLLGFYFLPVMVVCCLFQLACSAVSLHGMSVGAGGWDTRMSWGRKVGGEGFCDSLRNRSERKGRTQPTSCCRAGMKLEELVSGTAGGFQSASSLSVTLRGGMPGLAGGACFSWDLGESNKLGEEDRRGRSMGSTGGGNRDGCQGALPQSWG